MTLEILRNKKDLVCEVPGHGTATLFEMAISVSMAPDNNFKKIFGEQMPEIVVKCELTDKETKFVEQLKKDLAKRYQ